MTRTPRATLASRLRPIAAVLAVSVVAGGCLSGSPVSPPSTATALATPVPAVRTATATRSASAASASFVEAVSPSATSSGPAPRVVTTTGPTLAQLVGQKLVVEMQGTTASASLLGRIRRGEIGGVILFGANIVNATQLKALTSSLHNAARAGGQPKLLVMTDQEGGIVRRVSWIPPWPSARTMATNGTAYTRSKGKLTGAALKALGIDVDLAPVGDVPSSTSSFMWLAQRTFGFSPATVRAASNAFALGLRDGGEVATMKHFPGIGRANQNTDNAYVSLPVGLPALESADLLPYGPAIANGIPMIMLSNAEYPELEVGKAAGWSYQIVRNLLRVQLGFRGVTITDSLTAAAHTRNLAVPTVAIWSAAAGTDFLLIDSSESATATVYQRLLSAAESGTIPLARLQASYKRIVALKAAH